MNDDFRKNMVSHKSALLADKYRVYSREALLIELARLMGRREMWESYGRHKNLSCWTVLDTAKALCVTEELSRKMRGGIPHILALWSAKMKGTLGTDASGCLGCETCSDGRVPVE